MSRKDEDAYIEPTFIPRSVIPQKFDTPAEYLQFLKENELIEGQDNVITESTAKSTIGRQIFDILRKNDRKQLNLEELDRTFYRWNFYGKPLDSVANIPQVYIRSKIVDHAFAIDLLRKTQEKKRKSILKDQQALVNTRDVVQDDDDEDIFADAGRDYELTVDESYKFVEEKDEKSDDEVEDYVNEPIQDMNILKESTAEIVDTDMMDLDLDEIEYSNIQDSSMGQPTKKMKLRTDFESEEAWKSYSETQSLLLSSSRMQFTEAKPRGRGRGRGAQRGSQRGAQRGSHSGRGANKGKGKLDRELEAVDKVYQQKYGTGLK